VSARFADGAVWAVAAELPAVRTATLTGFCSREYDDDWAWRWMETDAAWTIVNATARPIDSTLVLELSAFHHPRRLELWLDGQPVQTAVIEPARNTYQLGPLVVRPGYHELLFHPVDPPGAAAEIIDTGDQRRLSFAVGGWNWRMPGQQP
jgi:hypothetical protein